MLTSCYQLTIILRTTKLAILGIRLLKKQLTNPTDMQLIATN